MGGATIHQPPQAPQLARTSSSSSSTAQTTPPEEDELLKRNTDCVYFLASPLTCKKGSECEYRHSDIARVNPRDCWYWLNGNCLNPKCAFRHPPLDGLLGSDVSTPTGPPVPAPHATPYAMPKQGVACIFFQKGFCLKGHLCPFLHGPSNPVNNKPTQPEPSKTAQQVTTHKPVEFQPFQRKQPQPHLSIRNGVDKKIAPPASVVPPPVINEPPTNKPNRGYHATNNQRTVNGKDADEYSRDHSPGFDVLVDNERETAGQDYSVGLDRENESDLRHRISKQRRGPENGNLNLSSRLRGRIKIPERSIFPTKEHNPRVEMEIGSERRHLSRYSPGRVRVRDRISDSKFAGPKRLSELKTVSTEHRSNDERFMGKRKYPKTEEDMSFEGPKPLSEILKRKRGANDTITNTTTNNSRVSSVNLENKETEEQHNTVSVDVEAENEKDKQGDVDSVNYGANEAENEGEGGLVGEDALLDEELEAYDENRDGEYEYEQMEGEEEDYNLDEGEYVDEDGDEYGKKEGVVYS